MRKLWIGLLVLAILMFAAVLIIPSFFDWNAHKKRIALAVLEATGRELTIRGDIDVTILPSPGLRVSDVRFANIYGAAAPDMVRLEEARVSIALRPLFEGRLAAVVTLVKPIINLETLKDGRTSWEFHADAPAAKTKAGEDMSPAESAGLPFDVELRNFRIVDGTVSYFDARSGLFERIDRLKSNVSFDSLAGPFRVQGEGLLRGVPAEIEMSTGRVNGAAPLPLSLALRSARGGSEMQFQGKLTELSQAGVLQGEIKATSADPGALVAALTRQAAPAFLSRAFALNTRIEASRSKVDVSALRFTLGNARGAGIASAAFGAVPDVKIKLNSSNLDLDGILSGTGAKPVVQTTGPSATAGSHVTARLPKPKRQDGMLLPANLNASIQLNADVVQFRGSVVRDVSILGSLHKGRFTLVNAQATMPGNSRVEAKGTVTSERNDLAVDMDVQARSDNLREVVQWLGVDVSAFPPDKLRRFKASARFIGRPSELTARKFLVTLDASRISGGINLALRDRPAFGLRLVVDRFNLDGYLPGRGVRTAKRGKAQPAARPDRPENAAQGRPGSPEFGFLNALRAFDANVDAQVKQLIVAKSPAKNVRVDMTVVNGGVRVRKASLEDFAGVRAALSGEIAQGGATPSIMLDYDVRVQDQKRLIRFLGNPAALRPYLTGPVDAAGRISGTVEKLSVKGRFGVMSGAIRFEGAVTQPILAPRLDLAVKAAFPELTKLVRLAAPRYTPAAGKLGAVDVGLKVAGTPTRLKLSDVAGTVGPVRVEGGAEVDLAGARPNVSVSASTSEVLLDLFLPPVRAAQYAPIAGYRIIPAAAGLPDRRSRWSAEPIDLSVLSQFDGTFAIDLAALTKDPHRLTNLKVRATVAGGKLEVGDLTADFSKGKVKGSGSIGTAKDAVNAVLQFEGQNIDIADIAPALRDYQMHLGPMRFGARVSGPVSLNLTVRGSGPTEKSLVSSLQGTGHVTGHLRTRLSEETRQAGALTGLAGQLLGNKVKDLQRFTGAVQAPGRLAAAFDGPATLNGDFDIERGVIRTDNLVLVGAKGRALTTGRVELPSWRLSTRTDVTLPPEKEAFLTVETAGLLSDPYVRKWGGTMYKPETAPRAAVPQPAPNSGDQPGSKRSEPATLPKFNPEDLLKELKGYKGLLEGLGR